MSRLVVLGIDGATWDIIRPNLDRLPTFKWLVENYEHGTLYCNVFPHSAIVWTSVFTGVPPEKHGIMDFQIGGNFLSRKDLKAEPAWETLERKGFKTVALNIPMFIPPVFHNCRVQKWLPVSLSVTQEEMIESIKILTAKSKHILAKEELDFFAVVFPSLDRASHLYWGSPLLLEFYREMDRSLEQLRDWLTRGRFIILSDHGFSSVSDPRTVVYRSDGRKGDHTREAILITNMDNVPKDILAIYPLIMEHFGVGAGLTSGAAKVTARSVGPSLGAGFSLSLPIGTVKVDIKSTQNPIPDSVKCDPRCLPFKRNAFDVVYAYNILEHIEHYGQALSEMKRTSASRIHVRLDKFLTVNNWGAPNRKYLAMGKLLVPYPRWMRSTIGILPFLLFYSERNPFLLIRERLKLWKALSPLANRWNYYVLRITD